MALIVEDGTGRPDPNSYLTVEAAREHCAARGYDRAAEITEAAVLRAMLFIEAQPFKGIKAAQANALEWPRCNVQDRNGYLFESNKIPTRICQALAEAAYREQLTPGCLLPDLDRGGMVTRKRIDVIETEYAQGAPAGTVFAVIRGLLVGLVSDCEVVRG